MFVASISCNIMKPRDPRSYDFVGGSPSPYNTKVSVLILIGLLDVEIYFHFVT